MVRHASLNKVGSKKEHHGPKASKYQTEEEHHVRLKLKSGAASAGKRPATAKRPAAVKRPRPPPPPQEEEEEVDDEENEPEPELEPEPEPENEEQPQAAEEEEDVDLPPESDAMPKIRRPRLHVSAATPKTKEHSAKFIARLRKIRIRDARAARHLSGAFGADSKPEGVDRIGSVKSACKLALSLDGPEFAPTRVVMGQKAVEAVIEILDNTIARRLLPEATEFMLAEKDFPSPALREQYRLMKAISGRHIEAASQLLQRTRPYGAQMRHHFNILLAQAKQVEEQRRVREAANREKEKAFEEKLEEIKHLRREEKAEGGQLQDGVKAARLLVLIQEVHQHYCDIAVNKVHAKKAAIDRKAARIEDLNSERIPRWETKLRELERTKLPQLETKVEDALHALQRMPPLPQKISPSERKKHPEHSAALKALRTAEKEQKNALRVKKNITDFLARQRELLKSLRRSLHHSQEVELPELERLAKERKAAVREGARVLKRAENDAMEEE